MINKLKRWFIVGFWKDWNNRKYLRYKKLIRYGWSKERAFNITIQDFKAEMRKPDK